MNTKKSDMKMKIDKFFNSLKFWRKRKLPETLNLKELKRGEPIVEMNGITKQFPGVLANDGINFELKAGEIHALLGENGAGKSTLMNILYGLYRSDSGEIKIRGIPVNFRSPKDAIAVGIGMVHQHFTLIPTMSVTENIILGQKSSKEPLLNLANAEKKIRELSKIYSLEVDPKAIVEQLPMGIRQRVEIIKSLYRGARILILDEPTSVLTPQEIKEFFKALKSMANEGLSVIIITHKLPEVFAISERVTVLRRGRLIDTVETKSTDPKTLSLKMVGREIKSEQERAEIESKKPILEVRDIKTLNDKGQEALKGISFSINEGEILGVAGIAGNGQKELSDVLSGMRRATSGEIRFFNQDITNFPPNKLIEMGIGDIPEDRKGVGLIMSFSIAENLVLETHSKKHFSQQGFLKNKEIRKNAEKIIKEYDINAPGPYTLVGNLSGGNLQKVLLAKVLSRDPKFLIIAQPTAGLDVGATDFIKRKILKEREKKVAILLISEDLEIVMSLSDRIAVIYEGEFMGIIPAAEAQISHIGRLMSGVKE